MSDLTFTQLVDKLTSDIHEYIQRDDGAELATSNGLLELLRGAVFGGASGGGGAQGKAKLPLDAGALDLLDEIDRQAAEALAQADPRPTPYGTTESYVRLWSGLVDDTTVITITSRETVGDHIEMGNQPRVFNAKRETTAYALVAGWVDRIESYFAPRTITAPILAACPIEECGQRYKYHQVDGVTIRTDALNTVVDRETKKSLGAKCGACGKHWEAHEIPRLAQLCGFTPDPDVVAEFLRGAPEKEGLLISEQIP